MKSKHILLGIGLIFFLVTTYGCLYMLGRTGYKGKIYDSWEIANNTFKIKITAYEEEGTFMPGAFFVCASAPVNSNDWRQFDTFRADDAVPIPRQYFGFVNEQVAYFYGSGDLLLTINGGKHWTAWKPILPEPISQRIYYWSIQELSIKEDGTGTAKLEQYDEQSKSEIFIHVFTKDFGQSWNFAQ